MLINVKMLTIVGNIYEHDYFHTQLSLGIEKSFITSGAALVNWNSCGGPRAGYLIDRS